MIKYFISVILFLILLVSYSQDTINYPVPHKDTIKLKSNISLSGYWNKTNTSNTSLYTLKTNNNISNKKYILYLDFNYTYGTQNKIFLTNNDLMVSTNINMRRDKKLYYWYSAQYDNSYSLGIKFRIQTGAGLGYIIYKSDRFNINLSDGLLYEYKTYDNYRNSSRLKMIYKSKNLTFESSTYYQPSIIDNKDYVLKSTNTLNVSLKKWISIQFNFTNNYLSLTDKKNNLYTVGTNFKF